MTSPAMEFRASARREGGEGDEIEDPGGWADTKLLLSVEGDRVTAVWRSRPIFITSTFRDIGLQSARLVSPFNTLK